MHTGTDGEHKDNKRSDSIRTTHKKDKKTKKNNKDTNVISRIENSDKSDSYFCDSQKTPIIRPIFLMNNYLANELWNS